VVLKGMLMSDKQGRDFLTAKEVSDYFRIPLNTVYRLTKLGKLKAIKVGKQWRYSVSEIEMLLQTGVNVRQVTSRIKEEFAERRSYPRINCSFKCRYRKIIMPDSDFISYGSVSNISGGGLFFNDDSGNLDNISIDDPLDFIIDFMPDEGNQTVIDAKARVVRKAKKCLGVKFRNIRDDYKNLIIKYVG